MSDHPHSDPTGTTSGEPQPSDASQTTQHSPACQISQGSHDGHMTTAPAHSTDGMDSSSTSKQVQSPDGGHASSGDGGESVGVEGEQEMKSSGPDTPAASADGGYVPMESTATSTGTNDLIQEQVNMPVV